MLYGTSATFDQRDNSVTIRQFWFWHITTRRIPLSGVASLQVGDYKLQHQLYLELENGAQIPLSSWEEETQKHRMTEASWRVNQYISAYKTAHP